MADAKPSRPVPQRTMIDGVVATPGEVAKQLVAADMAEETLSPAEIALRARVLELEAQLAAVASPRAGNPTVRVPEVGSYNERGATVLDAGFTAKGNLRVNYK